MTAKQYHTIVSAVSDYADRASFVDTYGEDAGQIWDACARSCRDILSAAGLTQTRFCDRFCLPRRTVENWCGGQRPCSLSYRLMFQQLLGLLDVEII